MRTHLRLPVALLAGAATVLLGASSVLASADGVPFHATFSGSAAITGPYSTAFAGTGQATHLGSITNDGRVQITGGDDSCPGGIANTHVEVLTAANGDTLTITSLDVACPAGPGKYHGMGHWTVTGGSGRFSDATGSGSFVGSSDFVAGTFSITLAGTISR